jgi:hypothetical protein
LIASFRKFCAADFLNVLLERKSVDRIYSQVRENLDAILKLEVDAEKKRRFSLSVPSNAAGSATPQCAVIG